MSEQDKAEAPFRAGRDFAVEEIVSREAAERRVIELTLAQKFVRVEVVGGAQGPIYVLVVESADLTASLVARNLALHQQVSEQIQQRRRVQTAGGGSIRTP